MWRFGSLLMRKVQMADIISTLQEAVKDSHTQSPDCKAVRRRSMHSLPADTERKEKKKQQRVVQCNRSCPCYVSLGLCDQLATWDELTDILTLANTEDVILFSEQQRQALHKQESFMVAQDWCFPLVEHLVQCSSLNLRKRQDAQIMFDFGPN